MPLLIMWLSRSHDHVREAMPAVVSSPIPAALHQLAHPDGLSPAVTDGLGQLGDLREHLIGVPDPRARRGVRHTFMSILLVAAAAVLAGARSFTAIGAWLSSQAGTVTTIAVDGKTLRGTCDQTGQGGVHLLTAMTHDDRIVLSQQEIDTKTNEITCFQPLLDTVELPGVLVTADAIHTQRAHASYLVEERGADYLLIVKANQCATRRFDTSPP
jgi:hypothetical protein